MEQAVVERPTEEVGIGEEADQERPDEPADEVDAHDVERIVEAGLELDAHRVAAHHPGDEADGDRCPAADETGARRDRHQTGDDARGGAEVREVPVTDPLHDGPGEARPRRRPGTC